MLNLYAIKYTKLYIIGANIAGEHVSTTVGYTVPTYNEYIYKPFYAKFTFV